MSKNKTCFIMMWFDDLPTEHGSGWFQAYAVPFRTKRAAQSHCYGTAKVIKVFNYFSVMVGYAIEHGNNLIFKDAILPKTTYQKKEQSNE